jgi:uncharacterized SAM-binding protein YcdF (DUF218 family)
VRRPLRTTALALAGFIVLAAVLHTPLLAALGGYLVKAQAPQHADVAFVLAGDSSGQRILKAAELVREGYAPKVLVSGPAGNYGYYECDLAIPFAEKAGYPPAYFLRFPNTTLSTRAEAAAAVRKLHEMGVHRVLLVTSDYHTRRAGRLFRAAAPDLTFIVVAAPSEHFTANGWWHDREGRKTFVIEWMKTVAEWLNL